MLKPFAYIIINPQIRPCDQKGCGYYGANRNNHVHHGVDLVTKVGEAIYSPISGSVRKLFVYPNSRVMRGVEITNEDYSVKIFYLDSNLKTNSFVNKGEKIGYSQDVAKYYNAEGKMTPHIHVEVRYKGKLINPTTLLV